MKKHTLTTGTDRFGGSDGKDIYLGTALVSGAETFKTLGSSDRLNGGMGVDQVRADLVSGLIVPVMRNIEVGVFTLASEFPVTLDLARAGQMTSLDLRISKGIGNGSSADTLFVQHAARVQAISMSGTESQTFNVVGVDSKLVRTEHVTFSDIEFSHLDLQTMSGKSFGALDITLDNASFATVQGDVASPLVRIHSTGDDGFKNGISITPDQQANKVQSLIVDGSADLQLVTILANLKRFDASHFTGRIRESSIGGTGLTNVLGGSDQDFFNILEIGGTASSKAQVKTGAGNDYLNLTALGDLTTKHLLVDGGAGDGDTAVISGQTHSIAGLMKRVESLEIFKLDGSYNLDDSHLLAMQLSAPIGNTVLNNLHDGFYLHCNATQSWAGVSLTVNIKDAAASTTEMLTLNIYSSIIFGGVTGGFSAPHISNLMINSAAGPNDAFLGQIGSANDTTHLTIGGTSGMELNSSNDSSSYVSNLTITNTAGVDLSGLENADRFFLSTGATVAGGAGDDVLTGGIGSDKIFTDGGDNTVLGSLGEDEITLLPSSGQDQIHYRLSTESANGLGHDTILNFNAFDGIDVSDVGDVTFVGNFADNTEGLAALSTSQARAFFNTTTDTLYIDLDHNKALGSSQDMQIVLTGFDGFQSANLIS